MHINNILNQTTIYTFVIAIYPPHASSTYALIDTQKDAELMFNKYKLKG